MFEKVNPGHPDKLADRIAGALVDMAYELESDPRIAVEVLLGHERCYIIAETSVHLNKEQVAMAAKRISGIDLVIYNEVKQDVHLSNNQKGAFRCGDNGIFRGVPRLKEEIWLSDLAGSMWQRFEADGKYIIDGKRLIICQSNASVNEIIDVLKEHDISWVKEFDINPLGYWTGGPGVDSGATNRKLGSDMGGAVTGGGLHGKDLSKADVSVNIYAHLMAEKCKDVVELSCAIGDETIDGIPYEEIVKKARGYIRSLGGFEKFAEWGLL